MARYRSLQISFGIFICVDVWLVWTILCCKHHKTLHFLLSKLIAHLTRSQNPQCPLIQNLFEFYSIDFQNHKTQKYSLFSVLRQLFFNEPVFETIK